MAVAEVAPSDGLNLGVEEEFLLLDLDTLLPTSRAQAVLSRLARRSAAGECSFQHELCTSVVEASTPVCTTLPQLREKILFGRSQLSFAAHAENARLVSVGEPVLSNTEPGITTIDHYQRMRNTYAGVVTDQELCGCHVHVGVSDRETRVAVLNHIVPWLPTLLTLTTNSCYRHGADSGFHSWRIMVHTRLPASGMPPWYSSATAYDADLDRLVACGMLEDGQGSLRVARLSLRYPTLEIRVGDAAATADEAVLYAGLARALVRTALNDLTSGLTARQIDHSVLECALWTAARHGLHGDAIDPWQECKTSAIAMLNALLVHVRGALDELGDTAMITALVRALHRRGPGSVRQGSAGSTFGAAAVIDLLTEETLAGVPDHPPLSGFGRWR